MLSEKYKTAGSITIGAAIYLHECGLAIVVTDGEYVQSEDERG